MEARMFDLHSSCKLNGSTAAKKQQKFKIYLLSIYNWYINLRNFATFILLHFSGTTRSINRTSKTSIVFHEYSPFLITFTRNPSNGITNTPPI